jgi:shikimate kinase
VTRRIVLTGPECSGKTTPASALARRSTRHYYGACPVWIERAALAATTALIAAAGHR